MSASFAAANPCGRGPVVQSTITALNRGSAPDPHSVIHASLLIMIEKPASAQIAGVCFRNHQV